MLFRNAADKGARNRGAAAYATSRSPEGASVQASSTTAAPHLARQVRHRCLRPRHVSRHSCLQGEERAPQQLGALRPLQRRRAAARQAEGNITIYWFEHGWFWFIPLADGTTSIGAVCWPYYLKRARSPCRSSSATRWLCARARRAPGRRDARRRTDYATGNYSYASADPRRRYLIHRRRLCVRRPGVLLGRVAGDEERVRRRRRRRRARRQARPRRCGAASTRHAARPARVLVVHLSRHQPDDARVLPGAAEHVARQGSADLAARRRHLRHDADLASIAALKALYYLVSLGNLRRTVRAGSAAASTSATSRPGIVSARAGSHAPRRAAPRLLASLASLPSGRSPCRRRADARPGDRRAGDEARRRRRRRHGEPLWELGLGVAAVRFPDYRGSDQTSTYVLPLPFVAYRGRFLRADRDGARAILFAGRRVWSTSACPRRCRTRARTTTPAAACPTCRPRSRSARTLNVELWQSADRASSSTCACRCARRHLRVARRRRSGSPSRPTSTSTSAVSRRVESRHPRRPAVRRPALSRALLRRRARVRDRHALGLRRTRRLCGLAGDRRVLSPPRQRLARRLPPLRRPPRRHLRAEPAGAARYLRHRGLRRRWIFASPASPRPPKIDAKRQ